MTLAWRLFGWERLRLTSADCPARLREISRETDLEGITFLNDLTVEYVTAAGETQKLRLRDGDSLEVIGKGGLPHLLGRLFRWKILTVTAALLLALTLFLPTRVWFIRVEGNGEIPARRILEAAEACGVTFGAERRELRSEQVKNHLLWAIPELRWAGVNTSGCTAVITVAVRDPESAAADELPGDITAAVDAVVSEITVGRGSAVAVPGQAVREGEILISGLTDLGHSIRADRAEGEVYGLTRRSVSVLLPENTHLRRETGAQVRRFSLLIGKKCVNFSNDSGIFHRTCVKMRTVNYMTLPGGFQLPVALVTDTYHISTFEEAQRTDGQSQLLEAARRALRGQMIAGQILEEETAFEGNRLDVVFGCREMIGVFRPGNLTEGDIHDRENGERGTG